MEKKSISYNTDPATMSSAVIAATAMGVSTEEIVRRAIREFASSLKSEKRNCKEGRTKATTVYIYDEHTKRILQDTVTRTHLTKSTVVHRCLKKYLEYYKLQIKQELESLKERLDRAAEALAA
ncbi:MAG: hypothetical protein RMY36_031535 [Nostoc sp. SerVER01]|nr:hypothetical protein [Nostoc sp. SerVER01]